MKKKNLSLKLEEIMSQMTPGDKVPSMNGPGRPQKSPKPQANKKVSKPLKSSSVKKLKK